MVIKPSRVNIVAPFSSLPSPFLFLSLIHAPLSRVGCDQAASKRAGRVHCDKREITYAVWLAWWCRATPTLVPSLGLHIGPVREAGPSAGMQRGMCIPIRERKKTCVVYGHCSIHLKTDALVSAIASWSVWLCNFLTMFVNFLLLKQHYGKMITTVIMKLSE